MFFFNYFKHQCVLLEMIWSFTSLCTSLFFSLFAFFTRKKLKIFFLFKLFKNTNHYIFILRNTIILRQFFRLVFYLNLKCKGVFVVFLGILFAISFLNFNLFITNESNSVFTEILFVTNYVCNEMPLNYRLVFFLVINFFNITRNFQYISLFIFYNKKGNLIAVYVFLSVFLNVIVFFTGGKFCR